MSEHSSSAAEAEAKFLVQTDHALSTPEARYVPPSPDAGVCDYCHALLRGELIFTDSFRDTLRHHATLTAFLTSSASCSCCAFLVQSFNQTQIEAWQQEENTGETKYTLLKVNALLIDPSIYWVYMSQVGADIHGAYIHLRTSDDSISRRPIWSSTEANVDLSSRIPVVATWANYCDEFHPACKLDGFEKPTLPTRVLDIHPSNPKGTVKLITTSGLKGRYIALSHCWGSLQPITTTKATLQERMEGIPIHLLPKTFAEAIQVSRQLGILYIWIDSLCIVQDDAQDWEAESARMAEVYQNGYLTLAATAASDGSGGLDWPFKSPKTYKIDGGKVAYLRMETKGSYSEKHNTVFNSPLGHRAWVLQEMVLSRRIVHFAENQIYWSCDTMHASEDNLVQSADSKRSTALFGGKDTGQPYPTLKHSRSNPMDRNAREKGYQEWRDMVSNYTRRQLTKPSDKLVALAGIIEVIKPCIDDIPFLGLWMSDLHRGLFWQKREFSSSAPSESAELNFPSWSWLSSRDPLSYIYFTKKSDPSKLKYVLRVDRTSVRWSGRPHVSRILDAELVVTSRLIQVRVVNRYGLYVIPKAETDWPWNETSPAHMDSVVELYQQIEVWALELFEFRADGDRYGISYRQGYGVLLLESAGKGMEVYKRVGSGVLLCEGGGKQEVYDLFDGVEPVTISLV